MARKKKCKVFVSYSRHDEPFVRPLAGLLGAAANDAVFLDVTSIAPGELWRPQLETAVRDCSVFILCWCCNCATSEFVHEEIDLAVASGEKKFVPVLLCSTPLPKSLADREWVDLRGRVVHTCSHESPAAPAPQSPAPDRSFLPPPAPMAAPAPQSAAPDRSFLPPPAARSVWGKVAAAIAVCAALLFAGVFMLRQSSIKQAPVPSIGAATESSTICLFTSGPNTGKAIDLSPATPLPIGNVCQDGAGNSGTIVERPPVPVTDNERELPLVFLIVAVVCLLGWLYVFLRKKRHRDASEVAAAAAAYFKSLGA